MYLRNIKNRYEYFLPYTGSYFLLLPTEIRHLQNYFKVFNYFYKSLSNGQITVQQLLGDIFAQIKLTIQNLIAEAMFQINNMALPVKLNKKLIK